MEKHDQDEVEQLRRLVHRLQAENKALRTENEELVRAVNRQR